MDRDRRLTAQEVKGQACDYYGCDYCERLLQKVA
jgi:hypothetical protein